MQFVGDPNAETTYSPARFSVIETDGSVDLEIRSQVKVTNGMHISGGELYLTQGKGSFVILDDTSTINNGGTLSDDANGAHFGAVILVNGTIDVGANGSSTLDINSIGGLGGTGTIRQIGRNGLTEIPVRTADCTSIFGAVNFLSAVPTDTLVARLAP